MSGLLSDNIKTALRSGVYRMRQYYLLLVPIDAAGTSYATTVIHDTPANKIRVIDHGVMARTAYNYSISDPGRLSFGEYSFRASNKDDYFSKGADLWEHGTSGYVAEPHECRITRYVQIFTTSWTLIPGTLYQGQVDRVEYENTSMSEPKEVAFFCTPLDLEKLTGYTWGEDDLDEVDLSSIGSFQAPNPEDN